LLPFFESADEVSRPLDGNDSAGWSDNLGEIHPSVTWAGTKVEDMTADSKASLLPAIQSN
jgi:hypothetical protein